MQVRNTSTRDFDKEARANLTLPETSEWTGSALPTRGLVFTPGANPTIVSYNASAVKNSNTMSSLVRFENFFTLKYALAYYIQR
jgi:hypothetical protein